MLLTDGVIEHREGRHVRASSGPHDLAGPPTPPGASAEQVAAGLEQLAGDSAAVPTARRHGDRDSCEQCETGSGFSLTPHEWQPASRVRADASPAVERVRRSQTPVRHVLRGGVRLQPIPHEWQPASRVRADASHVDERGQTEVRPRSGTFLTPSARASCLRSPRRRRVWRRRDPLPGLVLQPLGVADVLDLVEAGDRVRTCAASFSGSCAASGSANAESGRLSRVFCVSVAMVFPFVGRRRPCPAVSSSTQDRRPCAGARSCRPSEQRI